MMENKSRFHSSTGCFHIFHTNTQYVTKNYYERIEYGIVEKRQMVWGNPPVKREKLIASRPNYRNRLQTPNSLDYVVAKTRGVMHDCTSANQSYSSRPAGSEND